MQSAAESADFTSRGVNGLPSESNLLACFTMAKKRPSKQPKRRPRTKPSAAAGDAALMRIADALERLAPPPAPASSLSGGDAFVWHAETGALQAVPHVNRVPLQLLKGLDRQVDQLLANTRNHADRLPANNALLWGARGTGKSSLVKAVHATVNAERKAGGSLALIEIHREDIPSLPRLLALVRQSPRRCILFCDDLSFEGEDIGYKALKAVLEGGLEGRPANAVFYATSNRRHMLSRDMIENERAAAIHSSEAIEEKVSLSDRFGLWLGFHHMDQETFFAAIDGYASAFKMPIAEDELRAKAIEWSMTRGARSGRVAWQFIQHLAGELRIKITL
jgi:predicted AAA+ superfamily ATPase